MVLGAVPERAASNQVRERRGGPDVCALKAHCDARLTGPSQCAPLGWPPIPAARGALSPGVAMLTALAEPRRVFKAVDVVLAGPERAASNQVGERRGGSGVRALKAHRDARLTGPSQCAPLGWLPVWAARVLVPSFIAML